MLLREPSARSKEECERREHVQNPAGETELPVWGWDFLFNSVFQLGEAKLRNSFKVIRRHAPAENCS